ncbi:MAG: hypothetical protein H7834_05975 [Magnetococcus sp. YQC-9]
MIGLKGVGFCLPGAPIPLTSLSLAPEEVSRLQPLGQEFFHRAEGGSTELMIEASRSVLEGCGLPPDRIGMVISAPSLLTAHGLEIPAIEIRNGLGLFRAECLNLGQGCVGLLRAMQLAGDRLQLKPETGAVLVVAGTVASNLVRNQTHGSFFWGDGAVAVWMERAEAGQGGLSYHGYAECSVERNASAMRIGFGDAGAIERYVLDRDFSIRVEFPSDREQLEYIEGERGRLLAVVEGLTRQAGIPVEALSGVAMPSLGRNRLRFLLPADHPLRARVICDFRYAHMGAVDSLLFLQNHLEAQPQAVAPEWYIVLTPAFTAQWGGVLLRRDPPPIPGQVG